MGRVALETESRALLAVLNMLKVEGREIRVKEGSGGEGRIVPCCLLLGSTLFLIPLYLHMRYGSRAKEGAVSSSQL